MALTTISSISNAAQLISLDGKAELKSYTCSIELEDELVSRLITRLNGPQNNIVFAKDDSTAISIFLERKNYGPSFREARITTLSQLTALPIVQSAINDDQPNLVDFLNSAFKNSNLLMLVSVPRGLAENETVKSAFEIFNKKANDAYDQYTFVTKVKSVTCK